ncbi:hypothetical protein ILUMI_13341 [Ignelater luminosus]|uniref:Uncharacterized protein n=1 Tax=Ignelater luminosus TaxID=2038154 RepID=A0A8K0CWX5_IGNLU|nr:hypothetical protein ILUMI_13341 [Ignelater luminosus]
MVTSPEPNLSIEDSDSCFDEGSVSGVSRYEYKWFDKECEKVIENRKKALIKALSVQTAGNDKQYRRCSRIAKEMIKTKKSFHVETKPQEIKGKHKGKHINMFYREIRKTKTARRHNVLIRKKKDGSLAIGQSEKLSRRAKYFEELLNGGGNKDTNNKYKPGPIEEEYVITGSDQEEIREMLRIQKSNKTPAEMV